MGRSYHRLNSDYMMLHALCRFFLENTGPDLQKGDTAMMPFIVDMSRLFELFVAEWLQARLPQEYRLLTQEQVRVGEDHTISFNIDLVIYEAASGRVLYVLDTKYKKDRVPSKADFNQILTYAVAKDCAQAVLVYPTTEIYDFDKTLGEIRVVNSSFALEGDLEAAGQDFLRQLRLG